jgi:hypothetical protein
MKSLNMAAAGETVPQLILRDAQGGPVAKIDWNEISSDGTTDESRLAGVLKANANEPLDCQKLLDGALAQARKSNRRILMVETTVGEFPCRHLARYLDRYRAIWDKDYILVRVDKRWLNHDSVMETFALGYYTSPWVGILDANAQLMAASSNCPASQMANFPSTPEQIEYFAQMFKTTAQRLTNEDLWKLRVGFDAMPSDRDRRGGWSHYSSVIRPGADEP